MIDKSCGRSAYIPISELYTHTVCIQHMCSHVIRCAIVLNTDNQIAHHRLGSPVLCTGPRLCSVWALSTKEDHQRRQLQLLWFHFAIPCASSSGDFANTYIWIKAIQETMRSALAKQNSVWTKQKKDAIDERDRNSICKISEPTGSKSFTLYI